MRVERLWLTPISQKKVLFCCGLGDAVYLSARCETGESEGGDKEGEMESHGDLIVLGDAEFFDEGVVRAGAPEEIFDGFFDWAGVALGEDFGAEFHT